MYRRILVPLDGSAIAEQALPYAQLVARPLLAKIELLRVFSPPPSELSDPARGIYLDQVSEAFKKELARIQEIKKHAAQAAAAKQ